MVSFRLGEKRSIDAAENAASGHKMFIAAESDFSGGKVGCSVEMTNTIFGIANFRLVSALHFEHHSDIICFVSF